MRTITLLALCFSLLSTFPYRSSSWAGATYEDSLKQLAEGVTEGAVKAKKHRLAFLDFTDSKGETTPIGQFLAEELGTQIMVAGELTVVERTLTYSTLKKLHVEHLDQSHAKSVRRVAKAIRADVFVRGVAIETPDGVQVTVRLISPSNAQPIAATRATLPKAGPLNTFLKKAEPSQPVANIETTKEPAIPVGLGTHRNEYYELVVTSLVQENHRAKLDFTIENLSSRDLKLLCYVQGTLLKDEHGTTWHQGVEENREGLCTRGLELSPRRKQRTVLTFTASSETSASRFTLQFHEKLPRRDASFTIEGLKLEPSSGSGDTTP